MTARPTVFVVDADADVRESLELLIDGCGWQPKTFASAKEFLAQPRIPAPSCMVLDVALPGLSGLDLQKLVADGPTCRSSSSPATATCHDRPGHESGRRGVPDQAVPSPTCS
jgi:DNA-binding NtrC family response regulator